MNEVGKDLMVQKDLEKEEISGRWHGKYRTKIKH